MELRKTKVKDWISKESYKVGQDSTVSAAYKIMISKNIRHLVVIGPKGKMVGVFTSYDIIRPLLKRLTTKAVKLGGDDLASVFLKDKVSAHMSKPRHSIQLEDPIEKAAKMMLKAPISAIPVLNKRKQPAGILTRSDLLNQLCDLMNTQSKDRSLSDLLSEQDRSLLGYLE